MQFWSQKLQIASPSGLERFPRVLPHSLRFSTFAGIVLFLGFAVCRGYSLSGLGALRRGYCPVSRVWGRCTAVLPPDPRFRQRVAFGPFPSGAGRVTFKEKGCLTVFEGFCQIHCVSSVSCSKMQPSSKVFTGFGLRAPPCVGRCAAETFKRVWKTRFFREEDNILETCLNKSGKPSFKEIVFLLKAPVGLEKKFFNHV